jgi:hypothetical protein
MKLSSNIEPLKMAGTPMIFIRELTIKVRQSLSSRFMMETVLVVSPHNHGITEEVLTLEFVTITRFSLISPVPESSPPPILARISTVIWMRVLHL